MKARFTGIGAEPKRIAILASLVMAAGYWFISNRSSPKYQILRSRSPGIHHSEIDPTVHEELLTTLKDLKAQAGSRSLFELPAAPAAVPSPSDPSQIERDREPIGPQQPPGLTPTLPTTSPIPLKFYGFVNQSKTGIRRAFFLEGDDIFIASEGQLVKSRYKIVRIGVTSAVVEDIQVETTNSRQLLKLVDEIQG